MKSQMKRRAGLAATLASLCALAACQSCQPAPPANTNQPAQQPPREKTTGKRGGQLTYRLAAAPKTFNYVMSTGDDMTPTLAYFLLESRLVELDHDAQTYAPALAESWKLSADERNVEVTLRD